MSCRFTSAASSISADDADDDEGSPDSRKLLDRIKSLLEDQFEKQEHILAKCIEDSIENVSLVSPYMAQHPSDFGSWRAARSSLNVPASVMQQRQSSASAADASAGDIGSWRRFRARSDTAGEELAQTAEANSSALAKNEEDDEIKSPTSAPGKPRSAWEGSSDTVEPCRGMLVSSPSGSVAKVQDFSVVPSTASARPGRKTCEVKEAGPRDAFDPVFSRTLTGMSCSDDFVAMQTAASVQKLYKMKTKKLNKLSKSRTRSFKSRRTNFVDPDALADTVWNRMVAKGSEWGEWWEELEEPERSTCAAKLVHARYFEVVSASVIALNTGFAVYSSNYEVSHLGQGGGGMVGAFEKAFLLFYMSELVAKLAAHRLYFFCNKDMAWNIFDLFLVLQSIYEQLILVLNRGGGTNLTFMRTLRVLKIAKVLRVVRVLRFFTELRVMMNSLIGSIISMFWSFIMLAFIFLMFGLVFVQGSATMLQELQLESDWRALESDPGVRALLANFGSVELAMFSLFKASTSGQDWEVYSDALSVCGWHYPTFFVFFIGFYQIAVINILTGIFVDQAMKLAMPDRDTRALEYRRDEVAAYEELAALFYDMDTNNNGTITVEEFATKLSLNNGKFRAQLALLGLYVDDANLFFNTVAHMCHDSNLCNEQEADIPSFVANCMRLKGYATNLDLQCVAGDIVKLGEVLKTHRALLEDSVSWLLGSIKEQADPATKERRTAPKDSPPLPAVPGKQLDP